MKPEILRALLAAGATAEMLVAAVEADYNSKRVAREKDATRKKMSRGLLRTGSDTIPHTPLDITTNNKTKKNISPRGAGTNPRALGTNPRNQTPGVLGWMALFENFWTHFPKKVGKGSARKAYRNALTRASAEEILAGAKRYAASKPDPQYTKHPSTWLNADCWLDEEGKVISFRASTGPQRSYAEIVAARATQEGK
jgi:hypothetical protein